MARTTKTGAGTALARVVIPYSPRPQQRQLHDSLKRFNVLVCHRRFGKTVMCVNEVIKRAATCPLDRPRYGYLAPFRNQAKQIAWDYVKQYCQPIPGATFNEAELRADLPNGARIQLFGADNPDALRGLYLDGVVFDEYAQMDPRTWSEVIRPLLSDRRGWAIFIGTPCGDNHFKTVFDQAHGAEDWLAVILRASETGVIAPAELRAAKRVMGPERYAQEFECDWSAAVQGAYYAALIKQAEAESRLLGHLYEPSLAVSTAWDLGMGDRTAISFWQVAGAEHRCIDYYEASGAGLDHYARVLQDKGYVYDRHYLPHDVQVRELGTGRSRLEILAGLGIRGTVVPRLPVEDGIAAVRALLPKVWFDRERTADLRRALSNYRTEYDDKRKVFRAGPLHDWSSHAADCVRYYAVGRGQTAPGGLPSQPETPWVV